MSKVAVMLSVDRPEGAMSSHFGKAKWFMIVDTEGGSPSFIRNEGLNGRSAAELAVRQGCTDVILAEIGDGALGHLQSAGIRAWAVPAIVSGQEALRMFGEGQLSSLPAAVAAERGAHHGCGCSSAAGADGGHRCCG